MGTFTTSADPDDMQHNAAFHQDLHCLSRKKRSSDQKIQYLKKYNLTYLDMYNGLSQVYCIKPVGRIH